MKFLKFLSALIFLLIFSSGVYAQTNYSVFEKIYTPTIQELIKATVVSVSLPTQPTYGVLILESDNEIPIPWIAINKYTETKLEIKTTITSAIIGDKNSLTDQNYDTTAEFNLDEDKGTAFIELQADNAFKADTLYLSLDNNVALPHTIALKAQMGNNWKTIVAKKRLDSTSLSFPETTAKKWRIEFEHAQPLRMREISFNNNKNETLAEVEIRWLALPNKTYTLYSDARTYANIQTSEPGTLQGTDLKVIKAQLGESKPNPTFKEPDVDNDGVSDIKDNCVQIANTDQKDIDDNGRGDACEDFDGDNIVNSKDNCPDQPNYNQSDIDADGIGDTCDKEESRLTEKNPWLPWTAMGIAAFVVIAIVIKTARNNS